MLDIDRSRVNVHTKWTVLFEFQVWDHINVSTCLSTTVDVVTNCQGYSLISAAMDKWADSLDLEDEGLDTEDKGIVVPMFTMDAQQHAVNEIVDLEDFDRWWELNLVKFEVVNVEYNDETRTVES